MPFYLVPMTACEDCDEPLYEHVIIEAASASDAEEHAQYDLSTAVFGQPADIDESARIDPTPENCTWPVFTERNFEREEESLRPVLKASIRKVLA